MKPPIGKQYDNPMLILGCSFAFGHALKLEDTLAYKIMKKMHRKVYNRAFDFNFSFHNAYYQFLQKDFYDNCPNVKTILYIYLGEESVIRAKGLYLEDVVSGNTASEYLRYIINNNKFKQYSFFSKNSLFNLNIIRLIKITLFKKYMKEIDEVEFCKKFFIEMRDMANSHWGNVKFVILNYSNNSEDILLESLEQEGFTIINLTDITDENIVEDPKYHVAFNDDHPNGLAWDIVVNGILDKI